MLLRQSFGFQVATPQNHSQESPWMPTRLPQISCRSKHRFLCLGLCMTASWSMMGTDDSCHATCHSMFCFGQGLYYLPDFISPAEEEALTRFIDACPDGSWVVAGERRMLNWGGRPGDREVTEVTRVQGCTTSTHQFDWLLFFAGLAHLHPASSAKNGSHVSISISYSSKSLFSQRVLAWRRNLTSPGNHRRGLLQPVFSRTHAFPD